MGFPVESTDDIMEYIRKENNLMEIRKINTSAAPAAIGPYSQAVQYGDIIFCSGQIPIVPETGAVLEGSAAEQAAQCFKNISAVLADAGTDAESLVSIMDSNLESLNKIVPAYSLVSSYELHYEPFAKTSKGSIKRFLYQ